MGENSPSSREAIYDGAIQGIIAWTIYAIVECCFACILPWFLKPGYAYKPLHWGFTVLLFVLYPIIGLILGGLSGLCIRIVSGRITFLRNVTFTVVLSYAATSTIVLAFAVNLVIQLGLSLTISALLLICILIIFGLVLSAVSGIWSRQLHFIMNPWCTIILFLGLSYLTIEQFDSKFIKGVSALTYMVAIPLISFFVQRVVYKSSDRVSTTTALASSTKHLAFLVSIVFVILGISFFLEQTPAKNVSSLESSNLKSDQPNVVLITMDTVRADHLSLYGYERDTTPNLKTFADEAVLYTHSIASSDSTLPTHASIFTGMYSKWHKAHIDPWNGRPEGRPLADQFYTIAEVLSDKGYCTMGVVANGGFLSKEFAMDQGFMCFDQRMPTRFFSSFQKFFFRQFLSDIIKCMFPPDYEWWCRNAEEINKEVFTLLDKVVKDDESFFFFINYMDAHWPYIPPPPYDTRYPGKDVTFNSVKSGAMTKGVMKLERKITKEEYNHVVSQYDGGIAYIDNSIEKLISRLKELGLYENSLIIITSDHGEAFGERGLLNHGVSTYQDQVYVPLIIKYPNSQKGRVVDELVSSIDIMPTILDVLRVKIPDVVQGMSLTNIATGKSREILAESFPFENMIGLHQRFDRLEKAIFSGQFKFISSSAGKKELYNLLQDPNEMKNLYEKDNKVAMDLESKLMQWTSIGVPEYETPAEVKIDKDALERLKALGYIQ